MPASTGHVPLGAEATVTGVRFGAVRQSGVHRVRGGARATIAG